MSETEQPSAALSPGTIEKIVRAANAQARLSTTTVEAVRGWLSDALAGAGRRAGATALTRADVDGLEKAYTKFRNMIAALQASDDPPPQLPVSDGGWTAWDQWLIGHRNFGFRQGRPDSSDWRLIAALLALYETVSGKPASAAQPDGPTMRFLEFAGQALAEAGNHFRPPNAEALRKQLPELRQSYLPMERRALAEIRAKAAG